MLLSQRLPHGDGIFQFGGDEVEGDRLLSATRMRVPPLHQNPLRHRLIVSQNFLKVRLHRSQRNGQAGRATLQGARAIEAARRQPLAPEWMIAPQITIHESGADADGVLRPEVGGRVDSFRDVAEDFQRLLAHRHVEIVERRLRVGRNAERFQDLSDVRRKGHVRPVRRQAADARCRATAGHRRLE